MAFEAKDYAISDILNKSVFDIPRNQRRYVWKKPHWQDLYEDIVFSIAKTIYPTYAVTPYNLVPVCKDCNFAKSDSIMIPDSAPLHPYYDEVDSINWLEAQLIERDEGIVAEFSVSQDLQKSDVCLYQRLKRHMDLYYLNKAYAIQATTEIAENLPFWKKKYKEWGREEFKTYLTELLAAKESFQYNTWNTALLRALIENIDIVVSEE